MKEEGGEREQGGFLAAVLAGGGGEGGADLADQIAAEPEAAGRVEQACMEAGTFPKRVGVPMMTASASARSFAYATGMWAKAFFASVPPIFSKTLRRQNFRLENIFTCAAGDRFWCLLQRRWAIW